MSYDVDIRIDTGKLDDDGSPTLTCVEEVRNYTWNVMPMIAKATGWDSLNAQKGRSCAELIPILKAGIEDMEAKPDEYKLLNPPNGWGDFGGCLMFLKDILDACERHPKAVLWVY